MHKEEEQQKLIKEKILSILINSCFLDKDRKNFYKEMQEIATLTMKVDPLVFLKKPELHEVVKGGNKTTARLMLVVLLLCCMIAKDGEECSKIKSYIKNINVISRERGKYTLRLDQDILESIKFETFKNIRNWTPAEIIASFLEDQAIVKLLSNIDEQYAKYEKTNIAELSKARLFSLFHSNDSYNLQNSGMQCSIQ